MNKTHIYNLFSCILCSPLLFLFINGFDGMVYYLLLIPLPVLITRHKYIIIGLFLSAIVAVFLSFNEPRRQFDPFDPWINTLFLSIKYGIFQYIIYICKVVLLKKIVRPITTKEQ